MTTTRRPVRPIIERVRAEREPAGGQDLGQQFVGAGLEERHLAGRDAIERRLVRVVDADAQPGLGEGQAQGQADMAAAAEDDDVEVGASSVMAASLPGRCAASPPRWS